MRLRVISQFRNLSKLPKVQLRHASEKKQYDLIGPPHPISNLRYIKVAINENESSSERELRLKREEVQAWNQSFWLSHNEEFLAKKNLFIESRMKSRENSDNRTLGAEEMSVFYKKFLDDNWKKHLLYNFQWYQKNILLTALDFQNKMFRIIKKIYN